ncbi:MAG: SDR family oxidoreductase [OCS116 cluster bacterium]|uniref:Oxidoreductase n=1 Tax=OCS116 cluster bacterium TaxID=2030921 RepID=A0A2A4Z7D1_9PROT|nr:SDR family oxidoreductase [OCS116 cluster bacterium]
MHRFDGKIVIITGAGGAIGRATAIRLAEEGASLALVDIDAEGLKATAELLPEDTTVELYRVDIASEVEVKTCVKHVVETFGQIDVLFNNAGLVCEARPIGAQSLDNWKRVMEVNVYGGMMFTDAVAPYMIAAKGGAIVNTASVAGIRAGAGGNAYSASKAAVINMTKTAACDFGSHGIRVNAICPGLVESNMTKPVFDYARSKGKEDKLGARCELRRFGHASEIASVVAFLASDDASYITGQSLAVDGGNSASLNLPDMKY